MIAIEALLETVGQVLRYRKSWLDKRFGEVGEIHIYPLFKELTIPEDLRKLMDVPLSCYAIAYLDYLKATDGKQKEEASDRMVDAVNDLRNFDIPRRTREKAIIFLREALRHSPLREHVPQRSATSYEGSAGAHSLPLDTIIRQ